MLSKRLQQSEPLKRQGWIRRILNRFSEDVPDELAACIDCNTVICGGDKFDKCTRRLGRVTSLKVPTSD
jgi:hypothetical protein